MCKTMQEVRSYRANKILHCYGGMHDWVKLCVYQCHEIRSYRANEILHCDCISSRSKVGQDHSSSNSSKAMVV